jgi:hypothetical protein
VKHGENNGKLKHSSGERSNDEVTWNQHECLITTSVQTLYVYSTSMMLYNDL